jgi:hypothetical protein
MHELHALQRPDDASHARSWHPFTPKASETLQPIGFAVAQAGLDYESEVIARCTAHSACAMMCSFA